MFENSSVLVLHITLFQLAQHPCSAPGETKKNAILYKDDVVLSFAVSDQLVRK